MNHQNYNQKRILPPRAGRSAGMDRSPSNSPYVSGAECPGGLYRLVDMDSMPLRGTWSVNAFDPPGGRMRR
jgi:hypothetical protein